MSAKRMSGTATSALSPYYAQAMDQYTQCRQPWDAYISLVSKHDSEPFHAELPQKPLYRGRHNGMEGNMMGENVQMHYKRFPDEDVLTSLARFRSGQVVGDLALQQFKNAQPFDLDKKDHDGMDTPSPETYMKLNYKNMQTVGGFLTRTGHFYQQQVMPLNPHAVKLIRTSLHRARTLGLWPKHGNPYWYRNQKHRPTPFMTKYDPVVAQTKSTLNQFCFNWLQTNRVKTYFRGMEKARERVSSSTAESRMQGGYERVRKPRMNTAQKYDADAAAGEAKSTVPGLMSATGLRRNPHLYSTSNRGKKRMGFPSSVTFMRP